MKIPFKFDKPSKSLLKEKPGPGLNLWAVFETAHPETPITFTSTREEAYLALDQYIYLKHYVHFRSWCELNNTPIDHSLSWKRYSEVALKEELSIPNMYTVMKVSYSAAILASLLRSVNNCIPMGCPFDTDEELEDFANNFATKTQEVDAGRATFTPLEEGLVAFLDDTDAYIDDPATPTPSAAATAADPQVSLFRKQKKSKREGGYDA